MQIQSLRPQGEVLEVPSPEVENEPLLASDPKRSREDPTFLSQEMDKRGVLPQSRSETFLPDGQSLGSKVPLDPQLPSPCPGLRE